MRLVTTAEMRALERGVFARGITEAQLMQRAGTAVGRAAGEWLAARGGERLLVLVGKGNNGGDALIAARVLADEFGLQPKLYLAADRGDDPLLAWARERGVPVAIHPPAPEAGAPAADQEAPEAQRLQTLREWLAEAAVVLDGILGIGGRLPLQGALAEILAVCAEVYPRGQRRIAVDVPTGVQSDTGQADDRAFRAHLTLATGPAKPGLFLYPGAACAGRVQPLDIGLHEADAPATLWRTEAADVAQMLPARPDDSHKGTFGKVLVVGASERYIGAAYLAGAAAVRAGAGLVSLAVPVHAQAALASRSAETTFLPLPEDPAAPACLTPGHLGALLDAAAQYDALAIGPGLGAHPLTRRLVLLLLEHLARAHGGREAPPVVIDADGLNALAGEEQWPRPEQARWVLTPHPGEMSRLTGRATPEIQADRIGIARAYARRW